MPPAGGRNLGPQAPGEVHGPRMATATRPWWTEHVKPRTRTLVVRQGHSCGACDACMTSPTTPTRGVTMSPLHALVAEHVTDEGHRYTSLVDGARETCYATLLRPLDQHAPGEVRGPPNCSSRM